MIRGHTTKFIALSESSPFFTLGVPHVPFSIHVQIYSHPDNSTALSLVRRLRQYIHVQKIPVTTHSSVLISYVPSDDLCIYHYTRKAQGVRCLMEVNVTYSMDYPCVVISRWVKMTTQEISLA